MSKKPHIKWNAEFAGKVEHLAALGMTQEDVGHILGVSSDALQKHYADAWGKGKAVAKAKVAGKLFEKAMAGDPASIFFYLKTQAGWREVQRVEVKADVNILSKEQRDAAYRGAMLAQEEDDLK